MPLLLLSLVVAQLLCVPVCSCAGRNCSNLRWPLSFRNMDVHLFRIPVPTMFFAILSFVMSDEEFRELGHMQIYGYSHDSINPLIYTFNNWTSCVVGCGIHGCSVSTYYVGEKCVLSVEVCPRIIIHTSALIIVVIPVSGNWYGYCVKSHKNHR